MSRALLEALVNPVVSTLTFGICARAFRVLHGDGEPALSELREIMAKAPVAERTNCPPAVSRALADIDCAHGIPYHASDAGVNKSQRAAARQRLRTWTNRTYRDWKRVLRIRPVLERLVATHEHISQLDHDFRAVFGLSPRLFRDICRTDGITASAILSMSAAERINSRAVHSNSGPFAQAISIDQRARADDADRSRGAGSARKPSNSR
jgi:hypothetical protein